MPVGGVLEFFELVGLAGLQELPKFGGVDRQVGVIVAGAAGLVVVAIGEVVIDEGFEGVFVGLAGHGLCFLLSLRFRYFECVESRF